MSNANGRGSRRRDNKISEEMKLLRDICPEHRRKDLEGLVKKHKGNEAEIQQQISEWWNEPPPPVEQKWEDVGKKSSKKRGGGGGGTGDRDRDYGDHRSHHRDGDRVERGNRGHRERGGRDRDGERYGGRSGGGGRGYGRNSSGGRGNGRRYNNSDRMNGNRGGGGGGASDYDKKEKQQQPQEKKIEEPVPSPAPFKNERPLQGAWGQMRAAATASTTPPAPPTESAAEVPQSPSVSEPAPMIELKPEEEIATTKLDVDTVTKEDTVSATFMDESIVMEANNDIPQKPVTATKSSGNVWATKGSAHLIQAEKPKPPPSPAKKKVQHTEPQLSQEQPLLLDQLDNLADTSVSDDVPNPASSATEAMDNGLPPSVNGANINASGWEPAASGDNDVIHQSTIESVSNAPSTADTPLMLSDVKEDSVLKEDETNVVTSDQSRKSEVLNMGHWETGDAEESQSLDFGFGLENDVASVDETTISNTTNNVAAVPVTSIEPQVAPISTKTEATTVSSATTATATVVATSSVAPGLPPPPPGLGVAMPPLPDKIVHVHELENKLESASLAAATKEEPIENKTVDASLPEKVTNNLTPSTQASSSTSTVNATTSTTQPEGFMQMPNGVMSQNFNAGAYGMGGVYNGYNAQTGVNTAFMGLPTPAGPVVSPSPATAGVLPQQQKQPNISGQQGVPNGLQQQQQPQQQQQQQQGSGLYGIPNATNQENNTSNDSNPTTNPSNGMPLGMQHGMPYNPALFYGQQHYQMGPSHGVGYGYGYGAQFGGVGGGFGYQQMAMQPGGAYGQPYDEQAQHHGSHNNNHQGNNNGSGSGNSSGGYNKNGGGGGYRGRNNHSNHNNNNNNNHHNQQYQNQYNPGGHAGYSAQPYSMGYGDFNQRGGYGPPSDPYMQNSYQSSSSGFSQDDSQQLGGAKGNKSKGNNRNSNFNGNMHQQYQQHGSGGSPQLPGVTSQSSHHQQFSGLQGGNTSENTVNNNNSTGLSYQSWGGGL